MKKTGFTYIEVMMATAIFAIFSVIVIKLNIAANSNINMQLKKQDMMMEAQKCVEEMKNDPEEYTSSSYKKKDGYYISEVAEDEGGKLFKFTVNVRIKENDDENEVKLVTHFLDQS
ncbi:type II secretion system protein [Clostridium sp.]|jgi:prepilin-type N-terminal cleavage/methylation domain-containing protein|uniref:type II secretion system protein n=1 Tax=Clostridium sp. TaxID=1506 RepID=UPI003A5C3199